MLTQLLGRKLKVRLSLVSPLSPGFFPYGSFIQAKQYYVKCREMLYISPNPTVEQGRHTHTHECTDSQASTAGRKSHFPTSWVCQRAFCGGLPARVPFRGKASFRPHPSPTKAWYTKGLAFSPFRYHGWNPEPGKWPLKQNTARSLQSLNLQFCLWDFLLLRYSSGK